MLENLELDCLINQIKSKVSLEAQIIKPNLSYVVPIMTFHLLYSLSLQQHILRDIK